MSRPPTMMTRLCAWIQVLMAFTVLTVVSGAAR